MAKIIRNKKGTALVTVILVMIMFSIIAMGVTATMVINGNSAAKDKSETQTHYYNASALGIISDSIYYGSTQIRDFLTDPTLNDYFTVPDEADLDINGMYVYGINSGQDADFKVTHTVNFPEIDGFAATSTVNVTTDYYQKNKGLALTVSSETELRNASGKNIRIGNKIYAPNEVVSKSKEPESRYMKVPIPNRPPAENAVDGAKVTDAGDGWSGESEGGAPNPNHTSIAGISYDQPAPVAVGNDLASFIGLLPTEMRNALDATSNAPLYTTAAKITKEAPGKDPELVGSDRFITSNLRAAIGMEARNAIGDLIINDGDIITLNLQYTHNNVPYNYAHFYNKAEDAAADFEPQLFKLMVQGIVASLSDPSSKAFAKEHPELMLAYVSAIERGGEPDMDVPEYSINLEKILNLNGIDPNLFNAVNTAGEAYKEVYYYEAGDQPLTKAYAKAVLDLKNALEGTPVYIEFLEDSNMTHPNQGYNMSAKLKEQIPLGKRVFIMAKTPLAPITIHSNDNLQRLFFGDVIEVPDDITIIAYNLKSDGFTGFQIDQSNEFVKTTVGSPTPEMTPHVFFFAHNDNGLEYGANINSSSVNSTNAVMMDFYLPTGKIQANSAQGYEFYGSLHAKEIVFNGLDLIFKPREKDNPYIDGLGQMVGGGYQPTDVVPERRF
ncbi:hypothetical protein FACS1894188_02820 [Clostridia bacterium]|nr:hypothetical protein FACS1894188_02820 [Clostridia bacterium]